MWRQYTIFVLSPQAELWKNLFSFVDNVNKNVQNLLRAFFFSTEYPKINDDPRKSNIF